MHPKCSSLTKRFQSEQTRSGRVIECSAVHTSFVPCNDCTEQRRLNQRFFFFTQATLRTELYPGGMTGIHPQRSHGSGSGSQLIQCLFSKLQRPALICNAIQHKFSQPKQKNGEVHVPTCLPTWIPSHLRKPLAYCKLSYRGAAADKMLSKTFGGVQLKRPQGEFLPPSVSVGSDDPFPGALFASS